MAKIDKMRPEFHRLEVLHDPKSELRVLGLISKVNQAECLLLKLTEVNIICMGFIS